MRLTYLLCLWRRRGMAPTVGVYSEVPVVVEAFGILLWPELGHVLSQRNCPQIVGS